MSRICLTSERSVLESGELWRGFKMQNIQQAQYSCYPYDARALVAGREAERPRCRWNPPGKRHSKAPPESCRSPLRLYLSRPGAMNGRPCTVARLHKRSCIAFRSTCAPRLQLTSIDGHRRARAARLEAALALAGAQLLLQLNEVAQQQPHTCDGWQRV